MSRIRNPQRFVQIVAKLEHIPVVGRVLVHHVVRVAMLSLLNPRFVHRVLQDNILLP